MRYVQREDPSTQEWLTAMQKPGGEGGCLATMVDTNPDGTPYDRKYLIRLDTPTVESHPRTFCYPEDILDTFKQMKYMKCVPTGRARK